MSLLRKFFLVLVFWLFAQPAFAQIALVSGQTATSTSGTMWVTGSLDETISFPGGVTSGNLVVAWTLWADSRRTMSCTHDGNAMTAVTNKGVTSANSDPVLQIFARIATTTGTGVTCTISLGDGNGAQGFAIAEFSGAAGTLSTQGGAGVTATTATETTTATTHDSGSDLTPDTTHNLFVGGVMCVANGGTWGNDGFTMIMTETTKRIGYLIQSSDTAGDWVPTTSNAVSCEVALNNIDGDAGGGGGATNSSKCLLVGVCEN